MHEKIAFINVIRIGKDHIETKELENSEFAKSHQTILVILKIYKNLR